MPDAPRPASLRFLTDEQLLAQCRLEAFRGSGPGGQKRNKTSNAIRLTHLSSGIHVTATESRSTMENKLRAIRRMRLKLACDLRDEIDAAKFEPPDWFLSIRHENQINASHRHPFHAPAVGLALDLLQAMQGNPSHVASMLGVSTTAIVKLLESEPHIWTAANQIRANMNIPPLKPRR